MNHKFERKKNSIFHPAVLSLMVISIVLNILLSMVVRATQLPFYIDTVGTIIATAMGGIVPGIITAFVTNAVNFFMDGESIFYAPLNMLIAIFSASYFGEHSRLRKHKYHEIYYVLILALIGGGIGAEITWYLYRSPSDYPLIVSFSDFLSSHLGISVWGCHMISTYITDAIDKAISVAISMMIIKFTPSKVKDLVRLSSWRQKPMSPQELSAASKRLKGRISIGTRINLIIIFSTLLMTVVALAFSIISFRNNSLESLSASATQMSYIAAAEIDPDMADDYMKRGNLAPGYTKTRERLSILKNSSPDIAFLYVYKIKEDGCHVIFDMDTVLNDGTFVPGDPPGLVIDFEEGMMPYLDKLLAGEKIEPVLLEDKYGSFLCSYYPVYDKDGKCVCYAVANVESDLVGIQLEHFAGRVLLLFAGFLLLIVAISILTTRYHIVMPIMSMTAFANDLADSADGTNKESLEKIEELDIHTNDEVEQLYRAFCKLT
ncbi:MAG: ECF transporter S component, partial [Lachnospiraceae bacterium]|nr:ECF transporter S component [Lachnospiraceae bacterium]